MTSNSSHSAIKLDKGFVFLRGSITAAKGLPCVLINDPVMLKAMQGLSNSHFSVYHNIWNDGWRSAIAVNEQIKYEIQ